MLTPVQELNKAVPQALCDLIHQCLAYDAGQAARSEWVRCWRSSKQIADRSGHADQP